MRINIKNNLLKLDNYTFVRSSIRGYAMNSDSFVLHLIDRNYYEFSFYHIEDPAERKIFGEKVAIILDEFLECK